MATKKETDRKTLCGQKYYWLSQVYFFEWFLIYMVFELFYKSVGCTGANILLITSILNYFINL